MSSRTRAADEFGTISERIAEIQRQRSQDLGISRSDLACDIECFYDDATWYHRPLTDQGRRAFKAARWITMVARPGWYRCTQRFDQRHPPDDLGIEYTVIIQDWRTFPDDEGV